MFIMEVDENFCLLMTELNWEERNCTCDSIIIVELRNDHIGYKVHIKTQEPHFALL